MRNSQIQVCVKEDAGHEPKWRPDSCWSWLVCAAAGISVVIVSGIANSFGLLLPQLMENFQATRQETGNKIMELKMKLLRTFALIVSAHPYCARNSLPRHALSARAVGEM